MKRFLYITTALLIGFGLQAQTASKKKADALFAKKNYLKAAAMYEQLKPEKEVLQNLGDCYYNNYLMKDAARAYGNLFLKIKDTVNQEFYFKYAHALMGIDNYKKADSIMGIYLKYPVDTPRYIATLHTNVPFDYVIQPMAKNTSNGDFGLSFFGDKVVFASYRTAAGSYGWNDKPYLDLFEAVIDDKEQLSKIAPFPKDINTKTHESSASFSADGKFMYFNRTGDKKVKVGEEKFASVRIMRAEFVDGKWTNVTELPFNSEEFSTEHPVLTKDGKKLYFSSDRPGGEGSFDIYYVDVNADGSFGQPQNLGNTVNTKHREQFPFLSDDGNLMYFASNGHQGLGGLDIFMSRAYDGKFAKPVNLGETINSSADDFAYVVDESKNKGYLSSNRNKASDNLYSFVRFENGDSYVVEGDVKDKNTKEPLPGTLVTLYDENNKLVGQMVVGQKADYVFSTEPNKKYRIEAVRDFYIPHSEEFTTNEQGKMRYTIELFVECYDDAEEIITRRQDGKVQIVLENIYFDLNKFEIKPEAARVLDVLYDLLAKYPEMEVELGAHTDSRATNTYNLVLSNRRAAAAVDYLASKGIERKRIKPKGYGEEVPLIKCGDERPCTEQEHSINRRCEFIILK
ncbi:OmpA family protein [Flavobacterium sp.]|uniref:OmpA family protein n=1 Tax=Flavobacterium sp. TaxID=239 RepID=UPI0025C26B9E|nr:OmpA family protein [Flavobacterium sp.]